MYSQRNCQNVIGDLSGPLLSSRRYRPSLITYIVYEHWYATYESEYT